MLQQCNKRVVQYCSINIQLGLTNEQVVAEEVYRYRLKRIEHLSTDDNDMLVAFFLVSVLGFLCEDHR